MAGECVVVLGAGATKACHGPLTNEILPVAFANANNFEREGYVGLAAQFIIDIFGVDPRLVADADPGRIPSLTLILSIIDIALERREALGPKWQQDSLANARQAFDYIIFSVLEHHHRIASNLHVDLFQQLLNVYGNMCVISLNYDIIADNSLIRLAEKHGRQAFADYCCDIATDFYCTREKFGRLLKLHGSPNWMYCPNCYRLDIGISESGRYTAKVLNDLYQQRISPKISSTVTPATAAPVSAVKRSSVQC